MYLWVIGDIHFSSEKAWKTKVGKSFINYMSKEVTPQVDKNDSCLLLGDILDKMVNPGSVYDLLSSFYSSFLAKFKNVYIIPGNHDYGIYSSSGKEELTFSSLAQQPNVTIISKPYEVLDIEGNKCVFLPHLPNIGSPERWYPTYYEQNKEQLSQINADYGFGHLSLATEHLDKRALSIKKDIVPAKRMIFGHIHTKIDPEYAGSVYANKINETDERTLLKINLSTKEETLLKIPNFVEYEHIIYPNSIKPVDRSPHTIVVYEVEGNISENEAKEKYKNENILRVVSPLYSLKRDNKKEFNDELLKSEDFVVKDYLKAYQDMKTENNIRVDEGVNNLVESVLKPKRKRVLVS